MEDRFQQERQNTQVLEKRQENLLPVACLIQEVEEDGLVETLERVVILAQVVPGMLVGCRLSRMIRYIIEP